MNRTRLVAEHGPGIYTICRRLCPDPEDAYQEVWAKVFAALPSFEPAGTATLRTWIFTIAHRHLVDRHRRRRVREAHAAPAERVAELTVLPTVEHDLVWHQRRSQLTAAIDALPEELRRVVVLHHLGGQPVATIARSEGLAVGTVKSRLHRARAQLSARLAPSHLVRSRRTP